MRTTPHASNATGPSAGPVTVSSPAPVGISACLTEADAQAHNWNANALNRHGLARTEMQLEKIKAGILDSPDGVVTAHLSVYGGRLTERQEAAGAHQECATTYAEINFCGAGGQLFRPLSIAVDRFRRPLRGNADDVNDFARHLADLGMHGLKSKVVAIHWEASGNDNNWESTGHFSNIRLAD